MHGINRLERGFSPNNKNLLNIKFEDLIFDYNNQVSLIQEFIGVDATSHITPRKYFDPIVSAKNVKEKLCDF